MTTPAGHDDELTSSAPGRVSRSVERASIAVFAVFFLNGFNFATWAARLPANLTQAQRDFFGAHTYRRLDRDGSFHTAWTDDAVAAQGSDKH